MTSQKCCKVCKNAKSIVTTLEPYGFRCPDTQYVCDFLLRLRSRSAHMDLDFQKCNTYDAFDEKLKKSMEMGDSDVTYITTPSEELSIYPLEFLREEFRDAIASSNSDLSRIREEYDSFISSIKKDVGFMVQQFEMRKSADAYAQIGRAHV